jgi:predicted DNA-binding transcriptional regulator YafY
LKLKARLTNELAQYLSETPLAADQQIRYRAAHWQLAASVRDSWQLRFWILSQGSGIEVLAPKQLRKEIAAELMDACKPYAAVAPN